LKLPLSFPGPLDLSALSCKCGFLFLGQSFGFVFATLLLLLPDLALPDLLLQCTETSFLCLFLLEEFLLTLLNFHPTGK
jgi:hypothetical protein